MEVRSIIVEKQNYINGSPAGVEHMHRQSCSNDEATIKKWRDVWLNNIRLNKEKFSSFKDYGLKGIYGSFSQRPCIIAGSGPSLKRSVAKLKDRPSGMGLVSCLHNFHFMEDHDANVDFYVTLDSGPVTIEEVYEGGKHSPDHYWEKTKGKKLIAFIGTNPTLLDKWQGKIFFFNSPIPDEKVREEIRKIEPFNQWVETGGNVLGCATMITKGYLGSPISIFVGADFSFSNENERKFHGWDSKYDKEIGNCVAAVDIFGNRILTWQSYHNFKLWFDVLAQKVPGIYINASDAGTMGAYREGNIRQILQLNIDQVYEMFGLFHKKKDQALTPEKENNLLYI
jgi:hypothetical protein